MELVDGVEEKNCGDSRGCVDAIVDRAPASEEVQHVEILDGEDGVDDKRMRHHGGKGLGELQRTIGFAVVDTQQTEIGYHLTYPWLEDSDGLVEDVVAGVVDIAAIVAAVVDIMLEGSYTS